MGEGAVCVVSGEVLELGGVDLICFTPQLVEDGGGSICDKLTLGSYLVRVEEMPDSVKDDGSLEMVTAVVRYSHTRLCHARSFSRKMWGTYSGVFRVPALYIKLHYPLSDAWDWIFAASQQEKRFKNASCRLPLVPVQRFDYY